MSDLRIGITPPWDLAELAPAEQRARLGAIADAGIDHLFTADHVSFVGGNGIDGPVRLAAMGGIEPRLGLYLGVFLLYLVTHFIRHPQPTYQQWHAWISHPVMSIASATFIIAVLVHGWVGMRDVVLDYVHSLRLRLLVLALIALVFIACGLWALQVLLVAAR